MKYLFSLISTCFFISIQAQDTTTVYLDYNFSKTKEKKAEYYQKKIKVSKELSYSEIYRINGTIYQKGFYQIKDSRIKEGQFETYYSDGSLHQTGDYLNDVRVGLWKVYYATGEKKSYGNYNSEGKKDSVWVNLYKNGATKSIGNYSNGDRTGEWLGFFDDGTKNYIEHYNDTGAFHGTYVDYGTERLLYDTGVYENGNKTGEWKYYFNSGKPSGVVIYEKGEPVSATYWNENGKIVNQKKQKVNQNPMFPGGESKIYIFLMKNINYPLEARDRNIQGRVYVSFVIEKTGEITDVNILKGIHPSLDDEAIRVIENMPEWEPGIDQNRIVRVRFSLPIVFKLN